MKPKSSKEFSDHLAEGNRLQDAWTLGVFPKQKITELAGDGNVEGFLEGCGEGTAVIIFRYDRSLMKKKYLGAEVFTKKGEMWKEIVQLGPSE